MFFGWINKIFSSVSCHQSTWPPCLIPVHSFANNSRPHVLIKWNLFNVFQSISSMSDNLSLAPTDIYYSPNSTPRSMSLSSGPVIGRKDSRADEIKLSNTDIWKLPDFGDSPVSSPPRTPPPEPTPPPTPPPVSIHWPFYGKTTSFIEYLYQICSLLSGGRHSFLMAFQSYFNT